MSSLENWLKSVPHSVIARPTSLFEWCKYILWKFFRPAHPYFHDFLDWLGVIEPRYAKFRPDGRQNFLIGHLAPHETPRSVTEFLVSKGYGNSFAALRDRGEVVSLRHTPNFKYQYHVRIFEDGEVRAHYEYTVECHPFWHDREVGFEDRREEFLALLQGRIIPYK